MTTRQFEILLGFVLIVGAAATRLIPSLPPNFSALTGISLFSGFLWGRHGKAFAIPLLALFLSDAVIGWHSTMPWVYASFALIVGMGQSLRNFSWMRTASTTFISSLTFFIVTNFGVWHSTELYPKSWSGLAECFTLALPFFRNSLVSDALSTFVLFALFRSIPMGLARTGIFREV